MKLHNNLRQIFSPSVNNYKIFSSIQVFTKGGKRCIFIRTFLSLHELAYRFHEVFLTLHLVRGRNHCLTILKVILICVEPHLLFIFQCPCIPTEAVVPQDRAHAGEQRERCPSDSPLRVAEYLWWDTSPFSVTPEP